MLIAVNYHYIRDEVYDSGIYPITKKQFENQINLISKEFKVASLEDIEKGRYLHDDYCLLTFDDGLYEQYDVAYQVLKTKGIPGIFFVPTEIISGKILLVHTLQYLLAFQNCDDIYEELQKYMNDNNIIISANSIDCAKRQYRYDNDKTAIIKYIINILMSLQEKTMILVHLRNIFLNSNEVFKKLYMTCEQIVELASQNYLGNHTHNHSALAQMTSKSVYEDISKADDKLYSITNKKVSCISYPFGGPDAVSVEVAKIARELSYTVGFTMERGYNLNNSKLLLARFDTNDVMGGKRPLFRSKEELINKGLISTRYEIL